jgi:hypothetical protein
VLTHFFCFFLQEMLTMKQRWRRQVCYGHGMNEEKRVKSQCDFYDTMDTKNSSSHQTAISFQSQDEIIFVPTLQEYRVCGLHQELWWQKNEMNDFMNDATREVLAAMKSQHLDVKRAKSFLYQPQCLQQTKNFTETSVAISFSSDSGDHNHHPSSETLIFHRDIEFLPLRHSNLIFQSNKLARCLSSSSLPSL